MSLNIYLHFNGNCREVFEFYRSVFGGEFAIMQTFGDGAPHMGMPISDALKDQVMHVSFQIGESVLMGSDVPTEMMPPVNQGTNFSVSVTTTGKEETDALFAKLSEGGAVQMAPADMFWGDYFGACTDKFGINWMLGCDSSSE